MKKIFLKIMLKIDMIKLEKIEEEQKFYDFFEKNYCDPDLI